MKSRVFLLCLLGNMVFDGQPDSLDQDFHKIPDGQSNLSHKEGLPTLKTFLIQENENEISDVLKVELCLSKSR